MAGGTDAYDPFVGAAATYLFDPTLREWIRVADMDAQRWYPTLVTLGDGHALVASGQQTPNEELTNPALGWKTLPNTTFLPPHPHLFLLADGTLVDTGGQLGNATLDARTHHRDWHRADRLRSARQGPSSRPRQQRSCCQRRTNA